MFYHIKLHSGRRVTRDSDITGLSHGDTAVLWTGHGEQCLTHVIFVMSAKHWQQRVDHLHLTTRRHTRHVQWVFIYLFIMCINHLHLTSHRHTTTNLIHHRKIHRITTLDFLKVCPISQKIHSINRTRISCRWQILRDALMLGKHVINLRRS